MAISNKNRDKINKMNRASQNVLLGTIIQNLENSTGSLSSMAYQSASAVDITGGNISTAGSIVVISSSGSVARFGNANSYTIFENDGRLIYLLLF